MRPPIYWTFKFKNFYPRILVTAKIDTVGAITLIIGLAVKHGFSFFSLKLMLMLCIMLTLNPLAVARSAYLSGYKIEDGRTGDGDSFMIWVLDARGVIVDYIAGSTTFEERFKSSIEKELGQ